MSEIEFVDHSKVELVSCEATDDMVCAAAWVSNQLNEKNVKPAHYYWHDEAKKEWDKKTQGLINFLYRERHMSPFEHGSFTFQIDTPIFVAREFMRHRTFSYNEVSSRYSTLQPRFYLPNSERPVQQSGKIGSYRFDNGTPEQYGAVFADSQTSYEYSWAAYQHMLNMGVAREVARNVLPVGTMTQFYATCNPRNLMQFLLLRNDEHALYEIRQVAEQMEQHFASRMPQTYSAFKQYDFREEKKELEMLRAKVAQMEAYETYAENIDSVSKPFPVGML